MEYAVSTVQIPLISQHFFFYLRPSFINCPRAFFFFSREVRPSHDKPGSESIIILPKWDVTSHSLVRWGGWSGQVGGSVVDRSYRFVWLVSQSFIPVLYSVDNFKETLLLVKRRATNSYKLYQLTYDFTCTNRWSVSWHWLTSWLTDRLDKTFISTVLWFGAVKFYIVFPPYQYTVCQTLKTGNREQVQVAVVVLV